MRLLQKLTDKENLSTAQIHRVLTEFINGEITEAQFAAFLIALRCKPESDSEIIGFAEFLLTHAVPFHCTRADILDVCGTGGDYHNTFNISTAASFIIAGAGVIVGKHGNNSVSSHCGSADVISELGIPICREPLRAAQGIDRIGIGFLFAPHFHPLLKKIATVRKQLGVRTIFNLIGPLINPLRPRFRLLGVYHPDLTEIIASALKNLGVAHGLVVHGSGLDEITLHGPTKITELRDGNITTFFLHPADVGLPTYHLKQIQTTTSKQNAKIIVDILTGNALPHFRDVALINAAAGIYAAGKATSIHDGLSKARASIEHGNARNKLHEFQRYFGHVS